jgi:phytoene dehydrogenase-like protein
MISRRKFVKRSLQAAGTSMLLGSMAGCYNNAASTGSIVGQNSQLGHRLRTMKFDPPTETVTTDVLIIGGGVSGLSAARYLKRFTNNFILAELGDDVGGNAASGSNSVSSYPWGAHYLPLPSQTDEELVSFLRDIDVITGYQNGLPVYNEYYLCFDPKERLYINNYWQEGIIPREGVASKDLDEIERFLALMNDFKHKIGTDGKPAFAIPVDYSSKDPLLVALDQISMQQFLGQNNLNSQYLHWYVNYCCADDYGSSLVQTSAWAGIHYFASRKGKAANAPSDAVLTWPEGNYWLVQKLRHNIEEHINTQSLAFHIDCSSKTPEALIFDALSGRTKKIAAKTIIIAAPQFIAKRLLANTERSLDYNAFQYSPWMVSNITLDSSLDERHGEGLCWDNVIYGSDALGYVTATHQRVGMTTTSDRVITYYKPLLHDDVNIARKLAHETEYEGWKKLMMSDLKKPHPNIDKTIKNIDTWIWGHGMIRPSPGFIWSDNRIRSNAPLNNTVFFAHSDLSGISIFEEAFYRGHSAAKLALERL